MNDMKALEYHQQATMVAIKPISN